MVVLSDKIYTLLQNKICNPETTTHSKGVANPLLFRSCYQIALVKRHPHLWNSQLQGWVTGSDPPTVKVLAPSSWNVSGASYRSTFTVQPPSVELASRTFNELSGLLFPNHRESKAAFAQLSPKELLDCRVPHITNAPLAAAPGSRFSDMNRHHAYINHLELWDLHHELNQ